jgi:hypothetical protein
MLSILPRVKRERALARISDLHGHPGVEHNMSVDMTAAN